jgi:hypothetical protein
MDIQQVRAWAEFMDKAMMMSVIVVILSATALGVTTWLSMRFHGTMRAKEALAFYGDRNQAREHAAGLERELTSVRERSSQLERDAEAASKRAAQAATLETSTAEARQRAAELERRVEEANARVADLEKAVANAKPPPAEARPMDRPVDRPVEEPAKAAGAGGESQKSQMAASLAKFSGTKAAVFVVDEAPDAAAGGASINDTLNNAGWASVVWNWTGVSGIVGVVILIKQDVDPATDEAATGALEALRSAGFNVAKSHWPADWRRFRGALKGPQTPAPTDAPIRIVIGQRAR